MIVSAGCTKTPPSDTNGIYNGDGKGGTNSSKPPVADAGPDQTITILSNYTNVTLDGSDSYDSIGHPIQYLWKQLYGPVNCSFSNPGSKECTVANINIPGVYSFELKVWNSGASDFDTVDISILLPWRSSSRST